MAKKRKSGSGRRSKGTTSRPPQSASETTKSTAPPKDAAAPTPSERPSQSVAGGGGKPNPVLFYAMYATLAVGLAIAVYLVQHKLRITLDPNYVSSCNLGGAIDCDRVNTSVFSEIGGLPISLFAIPTYLLSLFLAWTAAGALSSPARPDKDRGRVALQSVALIGVLSLAYSVFLAFASTVWIGAYCLYCIGLYGVNLVVTGLAFAVGPGSVADVVTGPLRALGQMRAPIPAAAGVFVASAALAYGGYGQTKSGLEEAYKRLIDQQLNETVAAAPADVVDEAPASAPAAAPAPAPAAAPVASSDRGVRGGKKSDDGWTYFEPPLSENEWWLGNPNASVTIVKYADFQCGYCKTLARAMDSLKKDHLDDVRILMKHFPMDGDCNPAMRTFDKHPVACEAAFASYCAGEQGKFWEMHDKLYENQSSLNADSFKPMAEELELDLDAWDACLVGDAARDAISRDVKSGLYAGIYGTPRTYINNRLVTGSTSPSILAYYVEKAKEAAEGAVAAGAKEAATTDKPDGSSMIAARSAGGEFWIDPYEGAITREGRAVSQPGVTPSWTDYFAAKDACELAGKRLCTEEEWMSACTGAPAIDDNGNKMFGDDFVEGNMFPYGPYHEDGYCHDRADRKEGRAVATGSNAKCRTPSGIYDLTGNIAEWVDGANDKPTMMGGYNSSATGAACNRRTHSSAPGTRNRTTGFRCCADANVTAEPVATEELAENLESLRGLPAPQFEVETTDGGQISSADFQGKVTLVNFFASWCGPCKKEFPHLVDYVETYAARGFQIVGFGADNAPGRSQKFAEENGANFPIVEDLDARLKGRFLVHSMPATFLIDREGVVRYVETGFSGPDQEADLRKKIEGLL